MSTCIYLVCDIFWTTGTTSVTTLHTSLIKTKIKYTKIPIGSERNNCRYSAHTPPKKVQTLYIIYDMYILSRNSFYCDQNFNQINRCSPNIERWYKISSLFHLLHPLLQKLLTCFIFATDNLSNHRTSISRDFSVITLHLWEISLI